MGAQLAGRIRGKYPPLIYLKEARRLGEHSIDGAAAALAEFEDYTKYRDFKRFHIQQAIGFKHKLTEEVSPRTGERLSRGTVFSVLNALRGFFQWLSTQPGYRSHLSSADAEYFALSEREARIAKAIVERPVPTIDQIRHVLQTMRQPATAGKPKWCVPKPNSPHSVSTDRPT